MATFPNPLTTQFLDKAVKERPDTEAIRQNYLGLGLMPLKEVPDYELTWDIIKSQNHLAGIYGHDGVPIPGDDTDYEQMIADIINIMMNRVLDEQTVMVLRDPGEPSLRSRVVNAARTKAMRKLREKIAVCDDEVNATIEYLIMHALQGSITWPPTDNAGNPIVSAPAYWGNASFTLSMGFRANFIQNASTLVGWASRAGGGQNWQHASADPILDLEVISQLIVETTGMSMDGADIIMSRGVLSWLATRANVLTWFRGTDVGQKFVDTSKLKDFLATRLGYNLRTYDARWTYSVPSTSTGGDAETFIKFLAEGKCIILPKGVLDGDRAYFATAPSKGNGWRSGKYTWHVEQERPPWEEEVGVGIKGFPILKSVREVFVLDAFS